MEILIASIAEWIYFPVGKCIFGKTFKENFKQVKLWKKLVILLTVLGIGILIALLGSLFYL